MRNNSINRPRIILFYFSLSFYILQIIYNPPKEKNYSTLIVFFSFLLPEKFFVHQFLSYRINNPPQHLTFTLLETLNISPFRSYQDQTICLLSRDPSLDLAKLVHLFQNRRPPLKPGGGKSDRFLRIRESTESNACKSTDPFNYSLAGHVDASSL